jgi:hypothetical protein
LQDIEASADITKVVSKAGWKKIEFYAKQAAGNRL